ncbi:MAG: hypothetical protein ACKO8Z_13810 [Prosthecobacter sp.]
MKSLAFLLCLTNLVFAEAVKDREAAVPCETIPTVVLRDEQRMNLELPQQ